MHTWDNRSPIYQQLADRLAAGLLDGDIAEGTPMPSVRTLASRFVLNPVTVSRALQSLDEAGLLENRRGLGLFVRSGARGLLRERERQRFLTDEWPLLRSRLRRLHIHANDLVWEDPQ